MSRFMVAGNGGHYNRGCQAIDLGTYAILQREFGAITVDALGLGHTAEYDELQPFETRSRMPVGANRGIKHPVGAANYLVGRASPTASWRLARYTYPTLAERVSQCQAVLALGGDNFTLDYGRPDVFAAFNEQVLGVRNGPPMVLWGCSVGPFSADPLFEKHIGDQLRRLALVLAREDATVEYLSSIGVSENVRRVADPAFLMDPREPDPAEAKARIEPGTIGLNASALAGRYAGDTAEEWRSRVRDALVALLAETDRPVALIPHVIEPPAHDDHAFLSGLAEEIGDARLGVVPRSLDAPELKSVIGRCDAFVGARTHSTIAALGQCVPCGFIAYSAKAFGISRDMMGSEDTVVPAGELTGESLVELVERLLSDGDQMRKHLEARMPDVREQAFAAGRYLKEAIDARD